MSKPGYVSVLGRKVKIKWDHNFKESTDAEVIYGEFNQADYTIHISHEVGKQGQGSSANVLMHEIIHAGLYISGLSQLLSKEQEEAVCVVMENILGPHLGLLAKLKNDK